MCMLTLFHRIQYVNDNVCQLSVSKRVRIESFTGRLWFKSQFWRFNFISLIDDIEETDRCTVHFPHTLYSDLCVLVDDLMMQNILMCNDICVYNSLVQWC